MDNIESNVMPETRPFSIVSRTAIQSKLVNIRHASHVTNNKSMAQFKSMDNIL